MKQAIVVLLFLALVAVHAELTSLAPCPCTNNNSCGATPTIDSALQEGLTRGDYLLQPGEHCVRHYSLIQNLVNVSLEGPAAITCTAGNGLAFFNITNLRLAHLAVDRCGLELDHVNSFLSAVKVSIHYFFTLTNGSEQYVAMVLGNCTNFSMENSSISNTEGLGLLGINIIGQSTLDNVTIERNVPKGCFSTNSLNFTTEKVGGGAIFSYHDLKYASSDNFNFSIAGCKFEANSYCGYGTFRASYFQVDQLVGSDARLPIGAGGGLSLILTQLEYQVNITVTDSTFVNNTALYGGGAHVEFFTGVYDSHLFFDNCMFQFNGVEDSFAADAEYSIVGSALLLIKDLAQPLFRTPKDIKNYSPSQMVVSNSMFMNNTAHTATVDFHSLYSFVLNQNIQNDVVFSNCRFEHNRAVTAPGIYMEEWKGNTLQLGSNVVLDSVTFSHNTLYDSVSSATSQMLGVVVAKAINLTISGASLFSHNEATAVATTTTSIYIIGNVTFFNNSGPYGGGLSLSQLSTVIVGNSATLGFYNNNGALAGGAIVVDSFTSPIRAGYDCFLYFGPLSLDCTVLSNNCPDITKLGAEIIFDGNVSPLGSMIYGSTLNSCPWTRSFRELYAPGQDNVGILKLLYDYSGNSTSQSPLKFDSPPEGIVAVATPTTQLTVNQSNETSGDSSTYLNMSPGISLRLNVTSRDAFQQAVPVVITSNSLTDGTHSVLGDSNFQFIGYNVSSEIVEFQIFGSPNETNIEVTLLAVASYTQKRLTVNLTACPDGYYWENSACVCSQNLKNNSFTCTKDGELIVPYGAWVGNDAGDVLMFGYCVISYCQPEISIVNVANSSIISDSSIYDVQCNTNHNRGGVACGSCIEGYSTVLGSSRCLKCSNAYLFLLIAFAAYGVILIVGMIYLQLTISEGFLNGLLFFSNILTVYGPYLLNEIRLPFLIFYWLSLKVGFETCLFDGMTTLSSTALNFVFPFYLYFLLLMIVLLSRWSSRFSWLLSSHGCSPIKVFATILVMTYSSLLETCFTILAFTPLREVGTTSKTKASYRWTYDPSIHYFQHYHAALAVFAILLLLILIPAPFMWMFPRISTLARFVKFKPLYDAVWAPLKTSFRFWVSLRLILRIFPLIVINFISLPTNLLLLCLFLLTLLFVHGVVQPFHGSTQNAIDGLFQVELLGLTLLALYFTRFDLALNRNLDDVDTVIRSNRKIAETDTIQLSVVIFLVVSVYFSLVLVFLLNLMSRFPRVKHLFVRGWNYVTCKKLHLKQHHHQRLTASVNYPESPSSYGSTVTEEDDSNNITGFRTPVHVPATFSVLREPLLESSGVAEMYEVKN